jgi:hypothetical protein
MESQKELEAVHNGERMDLRIHEKSHPFPPGPLNTSRRRVWSAALEQTQQLLKMGL